jgi:hypothetical protein
MVELSVQVNKSCHCSLSNTINREDLSSIFTVTCKQKVHDFLLFSIPPQDFYYIHEWSDFWLIIVLLLLTCSSALCESKALLLLLILPSFSLIYFILDPVWIYYSFLKNWFLEIVFKSWFKK